MIFSKITNFLTKEDDAFGLTESILSILLMSILAAYSTAFITKRMQTKYRANLIDAINDEIKRDIQKIKFELWQEHLKVSPNPKDKTSFYDVDGASKKKFCDDIAFTLVQLPSWYPNSWEPNSNPNSIDGQLKNKVFGGRPVRITREYLSEIPFNGMISRANLDQSISKIAYKVTFLGNQQGKTAINKSQNDNYWTSIDITSEAHGWCGPSG